MHEKKSHRPDCKDRPQSLCAAKQIGQWGAYRRLLLRTTVSRDSGTGYTAPTASVGTYSAGQYKVNLFVGEKVVAVPDNKVCHVELNNSLLQLALYYLIVVV